MGENKQRIGNELPGFNLGFVHKFSFFLFPALVPRTPGGEWQVNRKCFLSHWPFLY